MIVEKRRMEGFTLLNVEGVVKLGESAEFFAQTLDRTLTQEEGDVLIDLSKINYMDSTGIGELVSYLRRFRHRQRKVILINPSDHIRRLFEVTRLDREFSTYGTVEEAVAAEGSGAADDAEASSEA